VTFRTSQGGTIVKVIEYGYDAFNRRISRVEDGVSPGSLTDAPKEYFVYDGDDVALDYLDSNGTGTAGGVSLQRRYLHGPAVDQVLAQENVTLPDADAKRVYWPLTDHLGSVRDIVRNDATSVAHLEYDSFGQLLDGLEAVTRYGFTAREWDGDTDLQYNRNRWYDPKNGKWISEDPIGFAAGDANLSRYVGNGPIRSVDPTGLRVVKGRYTGINVKVGEGSVRDGSADYWAYFPKYTFQYVPDTWKGDAEWLLNKKYYEPPYHNDRVVFRLDSPTADESVLMGNATGNAAAERELAIVLSAIYETNLKVRGNTPILGTFLPEFGSYCARWGGSFLAGLYANADVGRQIRYNGYALRYPLAGGPDHFVALIQVQQGKIMGIDSGAFGGADHIFDPGSVINNTSLPLETRCDLEDEDVPAVVEKGGSPGG
jgi:RHS repeat-associated protein